MKKDKTFRPDRVLSYFKAEWLPLAFVTLSGLVYNIGLLATPWFEGRLAQCLADILGGSETAAKMAMLVLAYIVVTLAVQAARFIKRFYVRRFANNINRRMKGVLYANLVRQSRAALEKEGAAILAQVKRGAALVALCVEGKQLSSEELAGWIEKQGVGGCGDLAFVIGSSHGLAPAVKQAAALRFSMGRITLPHQLARLVLCEQIYRAFSINAGSKYHK